MVCTETVSGAVLVSHDEAIGFFEAVIEMIKNYKENLGVKTKI